jgi:hypothetical protein
VPWPRLRQLVEIARRTDPHFTKHLLKLSAFYLLRRLPFFYQSRALLGRLVALMRRNQSQSLTP